MVKLLGLKEMEGRLSLETALAPLRDRRIQWQTAWALFNSECWIREQGFVSVKSNAATAMALPTCQHTLTVTNA